MRPLNEASAFEEGSGKLKVPGPQKRNVTGDFSILEIWEHSANLSLVAFQNHIMQATAFSLLEGCPWPGSLPLLPKRAQGNGNSDKR